MIRFPKIDAYCADADLFGNVGNRLIRASRRWRANEGLRGKDKSPVEMKQWQYVVVATAVCKVMQLLAASRDREASRSADPWPRSFARIS